MRKVMFTVPGFRSSTPEKIKAYEAVVSNTYRSQKGRKLDGQIYMEIEAFFRKTKNAPLGDRYPAQKPYIDDIVKIICGGLNGVAYKDESMVIGLIARKYWTDGEERVRITIEEMEKNKC